MAEVTPPPAIFECEVGRKAGPAPALSRNLVLTWTGGQSRNLSVLDHSKLEARPEGTRWLPCLQVLLLGVRAANV